MDSKLFIHIPKNGGMTIRHKKSPIRSRIKVASKDTAKSKQYLSEYVAAMRQAGQHAGFEHARWRDIKASITEKHDAFAIIRNPWSRTVSRYTMMMNNIKNGRKIAVATCTPKPFEEFLEERFIDGSKPFFWHRAIKGWYPQKDYVVDTSGQLQCDILRFEHYEKDVMKYFNLSTPLTIRNISQGKKDSNDTKLKDRKQYQDFYTEKTIQIVADWYAADIEFFGFTFDGPATKNIWRN